MCMDEMAQAMGLIMDCKCSDEVIARLLLGLRKKGESVAEVAGAAAAMRQALAIVL